MSAITAMTQAIRRSLLGRLYERYVVDSVRIVRRGGFRELIRQRGWGFVVGVACYYLVRDTMLYIVLPLAVARGIIEW